MSDNQENNNANSETPKAWHYAAFGGTPQGPVSETELNSLHKMGKINDATLIWSEGQPEWLPYGTLFPSLLPPVPGAPVTQGFSSLAEIHTRFGAYLIDQLVAIVFILPGALFLITPGGESANSDESLRSALICMAVGLLVYILIQATMISGDGQSIGKWALKIKIVDIHAEENPGFIRAYLIRTFLPTLFAFIPYIGWLFFLLDNLFIFSSSRRCLHDIIAGTKVVKVGT